MKPIKDRKEMNPNLRLWLMTCIARALYNENACTRSCEFICVDSLFQY